jgi:hypothetical protein
MRQGWKPEWDWVERKVWTAVAFAWAFILSAWIIGTICVSIGLPVGPAVAQLAFNVVPLALIIHGFIYAGLWLRRKLLAPPSGRDRDR